MTLCALVMYWSDCTAEREEYSFGDLDSSTAMVHIDGRPFLWVIEKILNLAPNLKMHQFDRGV